MAKKNHNPVVIMQKGRTNDAHHCLTEWQSTIDSGFPLMKSLFQLLEVTV